MKRILLSLLLIAGVVAMRAQTEHRILVTYFSWSGSTKALAEEIQRQTKADIYRIEPLVPYTSDYQTLAYQISNKEKDENARPALKDTLSTLNDYDIVFVGCPVWWFDAPMIIHSFLECDAYNFTGKTVIPFCTYATATYQTLNDIVSATPTAKHLDGFGTRGTQSYNAQTIKAWLDRIGISEIVAGVDEINVSPKNSGKIYNLNGVELPQIDNSYRGIYIVNGNKIVY